MEQDAPPPTRPYLFRATDASGKSIVAEVVTNSTAGALRQAQEQGYSNVQILTDESASYVPVADRPGKPRMAPKDLAQIQKNRGPWMSRLHLAWISTRTLYALPVAGIVGIIECARRGAPPFLYAINALLILAPALMILLARRGTTDLFRKVQTLYVEAQFRKALSLIPRLERSLKGRVTDSFIAYLTTEWRAKSLARLGRLDEALQVVDQLEARPDIAPAQAQMVRSYVLLAARQWERALAVNLELERLDPMNPLALIAQIEIIALWLDRPAEARSLLERARTMIVSARLQDFFSLTEAQVLFAEKRYGDARAAFEKALPILRPHIAGTPTMRFLVAMAETQLAIACAHLGDMPAARRYWNSAEPLMRLHEVEPWVTRARRAVGAMG